VVERGVRQYGADRIGGRERRRAVHGGVFSHEPRTCAVEDDQLHGFVYPAIVEAVLARLATRSGKSSKSRLVLPDRGLSTNAAK
jgi:hypothetical protein